MFSLIRKLFTLLLLLILASLLIWLIKPSQAKTIPKSESLKEPAWFTPAHWLTDQEIDWAVNQLEPNNRFKVLPAYQFHYTKEANKREANADLAFPELLSAINDLSKELVFIPVNNPDFHWSLLVYETKTKTFDHYDTLGGANDKYVEPLVQDLLTYLLKNSSPDLTKYLYPNYSIRQNNTWDCGVAVLSLIKRIQENYQGRMEFIKLGEFDFAKDRAELRANYLKN